MSWEPEGALHALRSVSVKLVGLAPSALLLVRLHRGRNADPLNAETRRKILALLDERPAIPLAELRESLPVGWSTLWHHVQVLTDAKLIRLVPWGKRKLLVKVSAHLTDDEARAIAILRGATSRRIAVHVAAHPEMEVRDLATALDLSKRVVYYHVKQLHEANLLAATSPTRYFGLRPTPLLLALLSGRGASPRD